LRVIGLVSALESLCAELSHAGVAIAYTHDNVPSALPPDVMLCLFRVAQEALQNALKYSRATELALRLSGTSHGLTLTIFDNGVGFDVDAAWGRGVGLRSMFERLQAASRRRNPPGCDSASARPAIRSQRPSNGYRDG
jgi:signal transduction histidine kinase